ncbi:MAG TPA: hypothetical protein VMW72_23225 [Sedimentisphaerales bacterium]|nr:hypothetical protein [Sedimentisphaerales bacterium]
MAKHEKKKAGLQKGISSIFKGVSIPQTDSGREPSGTFAPERTDYTEPKQPTPEQQKTQPPKAYQATQTLTKAAPEHTDNTEPKQPTPEPQKTQAQKSYQVTPSSPKAEPAQRPKTELTQQPKAKPAHLPKFMKDQQSKVEPAQQPKAEPEKPKDVPARQSKAVPARQPKADIDKKVSKKRPAVKISSQSFWQQIRGKLFQPKPGASSAKQKAMMLIMPLLFIVLIFMLFRGGVFGTSAGYTEASTEDTAAGVVTAGADNKIDWEIPAPYPTTLRDPMRLVPVEVPQTEQTETVKTIELIVKSILYSEDNPSAVISGRIVHEGEKIQDASVIKISKDSVEFEMNGKRWTQKVQ